MSRSYRLPAILTIIVCIAALSGAAGPAVKVTTIASSATAHDVFKDPQAVAIDLPSGTLFIADSGHHRIVKVDPAGSVTVVAGSGKAGMADGAGANAQFKRPQGIAVDSGRRLIYVADTENHSIRRVTFDGVVGTFAGCGRGDDRDGVGTEACLKSPVGLALDTAGNLYAADSGNDKIRLITPSGSVTTFAGTGRSGYGDDTVARALFKGPRGVAVSNTGTVFVADTGNDVIRKVTNGVVSTLAGTTHGGSVDGPPNVAEFKKPSGVALDDEGSVWVADTGNHLIRRVTAQAVTTIAGDGKPGFVDGSDLLHAAFHEPAAITAAGALFIADSKNDALRMLVPTLSAIDMQPRSGSPNGGELVHLFGSGFIPGRTAVTFDGVPVEEVTYLSSTELIVRTPAHAVGDVEVRLTTAAGTASVPMPFRYVPAFVSITITPATTIPDVGTTVQFTATGVASDGTTTDLTTRVTWTSANTLIVTIDAAGLARAVAAGSTTVTGTFGSLSGTAIVTVRAAEPAPPEPVPTPLDATVVSDMSRSVQFLYTGPNAIQKGISSGAIDTRRVAVLRGRVLASDGSPISGVRVTDSRGLFGFTLTRSDGVYDYAVNGGGDITLIFTKSGLISSQRRRATPWRDYVVLDDVYMTSYDSSATVIHMNGTSMQVAQGSPVTDSDGSRRATLFIAEGTTATIQTATGSLPATSLTIRATEFSVGPNGPKLMPGALPPTSAYTYCVELSADEAVAANATNVSFSKPIAFYVENFLGFPVGTVVPLGYYDRVKAAWIAAQNGVVVEVLSTSGGAATLDATGDGVADDGTALGVTPSELEKLAALYQPGQTLWRARISHFTPWDLNFPYAPPEGAVQPQQPQPVWYRGVEDPETRCGSTIDCQNQVFGEAIPIAGTPFALQYQSDHAPGYRAGHGVDLQLIGATVPEPLKRIDVEVSVQGKVSRYSFPAQPNQTFRYQWDGLDAYGRDLQGMQIATVRLGYVYDGVYAEPAEIERAFASVRGVPLSIDRTTRQEFTFWQDQSALVGSLDDKPLGFGGWTLSAVRTFEPQSGIIHGGAAQQRTGDLQRNMIDRFAGGGTASGSGDFGFARDAKFQLPWAIAVAPNGTVYVADTSAGTIRQIATNGIISTLATSVGNVNAMVVGPDEALYYATGGTIWRRAGFGAAIPYAGGGQDDVNDGIPATSASLGTIEALAFGPDGDLYIGGRRIRRVSADGTIFSVTGSQALPTTSNPDGRPAISTNVGQIAGVAVTPDGTICFTASGRVFAIAPDGIIRRFAGTGVRFEPYAGDGGPATSATLDTPGALAAAPDGSVYIADWGYSTIRRVLPNGIIKTIAGVPLEFDGLRNGGPAAAASVFSPKRIAVGPDNALYVTDQFYLTVRRINPPDTVSANGEYRIPSEDGNLVDVFASDGRHVRTVDAVTGAVLSELGYDAANRLATITDTYGNVTTIERQAGSTVNAIVSPFGKRSTLALGTDGYLESVQNPAGERTTMTYVAGQLTSMTNPRMVTKTIEYDSDGRMLNERFPGGGGVTLIREGNDRESKLTIQGGEGRAAIHERRLDETRRDARVEIDPATSIQTTVLRTDSGSSTTTSPDGTSVTSTATGDPRFSTLAPLRSSLLRTPGGRVLSMGTERTVSLSNRRDPLSLQSVTETLRINGRPWKSTFTKATAILTTQSPAGRLTTSHLNSKGDVTSVQVPGLAPITLSYDARGRVDSMSMGSRNYGIVYDGRGDIERITDPLSRALIFEYDAAGRATKQMLPDTRIVDIAYDGNGNLASLTPPARMAHGFGYSERDQLESYTPPTADPSGSTQYSFDREGQLTRLTLADGSTLVPQYDAAGRMETLTARFGTYQYAYSSDTGRLASVSAPAGGALAYEYDGPLLTNVEWTGVVAGSIRYEYDSDFRVAKENGTSYQYDPDGLLVTAGALALSRDAQNGLLSGSTLDQTTDAYTYNEYGEVSRYTVSAGSASLFTVDYGRDAAGRITRITETIAGAATPSESYEYDRAGRLIAVNRNDLPVATYEYDANNNRTLYRHGREADAVTYDAQDRLLTFDDTTYTYSANGDLRSQTIAGETTTFDYDSFGNLRSVQIPGRRIEYIIDGQNRRIGKKVDGVLTRGWLYADQLRIVAELDGTGATVCTFVYGSRANAPDYMVKEGITYRIITDHRGSPRFVVNAEDGTIMQRMDYDEFGRIRLDTNPGFQPFAFAGGLLDPDTGFVRFGARDYDPQTGRWTTKDLVGFSSGSTMLYEYAGNDPINFFDPSGLDQLTSDPHVLEKLLDLFNEGGAGSRPTERSSFITQNNGATECELWPWVGAYKSESWPQGKAWPSGVVAVAHTHPTKGADPKPSGGDMANADKIKLPIYTVTRAGIFKYDPATQQVTQEAGPDWVNNAGAVKKAHKKNKTKECSCSQIPR